MKFASAMRHFYPHDMVFEHPLAYDLQSNSVAAKAVQDILAQARTLRLGFEPRSAQLKSHSP